MYDNLEKASANGKQIIESSKDDSEKQFINKTLDSLSQGLSETKSLIEDKKKQVNWHRFALFRVRLPSW